MNNSLWISYDLGVQGDYESMYAWLDGHHAIECGDGLAYLKYEYAGTLLEALIADLSKSTTISKRTRIYVIYREKESKKMKGKFIFGGRKTPPWSGFAVGKAPPEPEEI